MDQHLDVVEEVDWGQSVARELRARNRFMPPIWGDLPLSADVEGVAAYLRASSSRAFSVDPEVVVLARKRSRGARPLSRLGLRERVLYRGLTELIRDRAEIPPRDDAAYRDFERYPLQVDGTRYVLKADISAYYEYIDHERLVDEVIAQTADESAINAVVTLLAESSGRSFGLPQMTEPSDQLAELYIDPMRRHLVRAGHDVSRFADDFRIACASYSEALAAWDDCDEGARALGLVLSELKTRVVGIEKYRESVRIDESEVETDEVESETVSLWDMIDLSEYVDEDLLVWAAPATGIELDEVDHVELETTDEEEPSAEAQQLANTFIADLVEARRDVEQVTEHDRQLESSVLLNRALKILIRARNPESVRFVPALLVYEPVATPYLAAYLRALSDEERPTVLRALGKISESGITGPWQSLWIAFVAGDLARRDGSKRLRHVDWLRGLTDSQHPAVAAEACLALARRRLTTPERVTEVLHRLPRVHRSTGVMALAALGDERRAAAASDGVLDDLRLRWALENLS